MTDHHTKENHPCNGQNGIDNGCSCVRLRTAYGDSLPKTCIVLWRHQSSAWEWGVGYLDSYVQYLKFLSVFLCKMSCENILR